MNTFEKIKKEVLRKSVNIKNDEYKRIQKIDEILVEKYGVENCRYGQYSVSMWSLNQNGLTMRQSFLKQVEDMCLLVADNIESN